MKIIFSGKIYNTFFADQNPGLSKSITYRNGFQYWFYYNTEINRNLIAGDLWDSLKPSTGLVKFDYSTNKKVPFAHFESTDDRKYKADSLFAYIETACKYQKANLPFDFADCELQYFSDDLSNLTGNAGKLTDYLYEISIEVYGRKYKEEDGEDKRTFKVSGSFLKSGKSVNDKYNVVKTVQGAGKFETFSINKYLYDAVVDQKLPCMLVKCNYALNGTSKNYQLFQTVLGGPNSGDFKDFTFHKEDDCNLCLYFICFVDKVHKIPVLIPLSAGENGIDYFKTFCDKISVTKKAAYLSKHDRYILNIESTQHFDPKITIYNLGWFQSTSYCGYNFKSKSDREKIISSLKSKGLVVEFDSILVEEINSEQMWRNDTILVFDDTLINVQFDQNSEPYRKVNEIKQTITKLSSNANSDFIKWSNSTVLNDPSRTTGEIKGLYCDEMYISEDSLLTEMNNGYLENGDPIIYLSGKEADYNAGVTEKIVEDWSGSFTTDGTWRGFKDLANGRAMWFVEHNYDKFSYNSSAPSNSFAIFGGCLDLDPDTCVDIRWKNWIKQ